MPIPDRADPGAAPEPAELPPLARDELVRYARHLVLPHVGEEGQRRLKAARVLVIGAGGLGSPAALYLAAAGVGTLGVVDADRVDASNLQRQVLHGTSDLDRPKVESARERLQDLNPHVDVRVHPERLTSANALEVLAGYDIVLDGSDNFPTRYLVNDAGVLSGTPVVYGAILRWEGQVSLFATRGGPCYRCLFREPPPPGLVPDCATAGVFGALPGVIGSMQALEALKWILGAGDTLAGRLLLFDALGASWREVRIRRNPECPVCGDEPTQRGLIDYERFCGIMPEDLVAEASDGEEGGFPRDVDPHELEALLQADEPPLVVDVREPWEWGAGNLAARGAVLLPLGELDDGREALPVDRPLVTVCRTGARSGQAASSLREAGYTVANLRGGLVAWARDVDPELVVP